MTPMRTSTTKTEYDVNQKRRRRGTSRIRRLWRRWSIQNPTLATLSILFIGLCLFCMTIEFIGNGSIGSGSSGRHLGQRMRRAKALLQQANGGGGGHASRSQQQQQDDEEEGGEHSSSNDHRHKKKKKKNKKPAYDHHIQGFKNMFLGNGGNSNSNDAVEDPRHPNRYTTKDARKLLSDLNYDIINNKDGGHRWLAPYLMLPPISSQGRQLQANKKKKKKQQQSTTAAVDNDDEEMTRGRHKRDAVNPRNIDTKSAFYEVKRKHEPDMVWYEEYQKLSSDEKSEMKPPVDYVTHEYEYPELLWELPDLSNNNNGDDDKEGGGEIKYPNYPPLKALGTLMTEWPQDDDYPNAYKKPIQEGLLHFDYSNPKERETARQFRDAELPFKLYNVPEVTAATKKWTDEYVSENFDGLRGRGGSSSSSSFMMRGSSFFGGGSGNNNKDDNNNNTPYWEKDGYKKPPPPASGKAQESPNNFFAFFQPSLWDVKTMGLPPVRNSDWTFSTWSKHAKYADAVGLNATKPHFYWQSGVPREERDNPKESWTFISRDLPSFSSPTETFFVFEPESQKGIQCRFGERGVVAATHYDSGRNMIAMVTGAKRYILAPPKECPSLGIVPWKFNTAFRHSLLNFGHINYLNETSSFSSTGLDDGEELAKVEGGNKRQWKGDHMSQVEREWMKIAAASKAIETVLKAGEVLYIPSHWFHYIVSLQKSAQCNVRSGVHDKGTPAFGGKIDVKMCGRLSAEEADNIK